MNLEKFLDPQRKPLRILDGIPSFASEASGEDEKWNLFYDKFAPFYSLTERLFGRLLVGVDVELEHEKIVATAGFQEGGAILEVSPGPGNYQPALRRRIGPDGTLVSLDLSLGMLQACRKRKDYAALKPLLVHGNGSDLPFQDGIFDGFFHVGGINLFSEPGKALAEFARVVKKGGVIAIGDEGFGPGHPEGFRREILTRMNPGYLKSKVPDLPEPLEKRDLHWFFKGCLYLLTAVKK